MAVVTGYGSGPGFAAAQRLHRIHERQSLCPGTGEAIRLAEVIRIAPR